MKKLTYLILAVAVILAARFVFAEEMKGPMKGDGMGGKEMMMGKGMMGEGMMGMHRMHGMMRSPSMVASNDGGVIVLTGNKLYKYDKNFTLVKEVEIKMDMDGMADMKKMCSMCQKMMGKDGMMGEASEENADQPD